MRSGTFADAGGVSIRALTGVNVRFPNGRFGIEKRAAEKPPFWLKLTCFEIYTPSVPAFAAA